MDSGSVPHSLRLLQVTDIVEERNLGDVAGYPGDLGDLAAQEEEALAASKAR